ncbi:MAG TPA: GspE/PulE family protein [Candidatus Saccharibacteria bacterium]|nr:GspE/PulE family protein [Candidatus Saccharibacteria bacterium]
MRISDTIVEKLLLKDNVATPEALASFKDEAKQSKRSLQQTVIENDVISDKDLIKAFSEYAHIPYIELDARDITSDVLNKIPERVARQYNAVLFKIDEDGTHHLAMEDPDDVLAVNFLEKEIGQNTKIYIAQRSNIIEVLENYRGDVNAELKEVIDIQREDNTENQDVSEAEIAEDSPIAQTVNLLLEYAIKSNASDIHIEPREEFVQIRYRIDGVLKEVNRLPKNVLGALVSRIKILSNLKIDERRVPQDGRFKIRVGGKQYALRVSTLPIADGEKIVMRILDESNRSITLSELGYWGHSITTMNEAIVQPNGMILVTGPTGSGKSTSLFSVLSMLNTPDVNISTIEDPVEYKIPGVNQTQTNSKAGMTFANGLRALLRQDPNIIMVGEIRDGETANLGVQAALTGHLVFSTLHTNNAATTLPRLLDMEIEPFLIASTVKAIVGQRLVRRLARSSRISYEPTDEEKQAVLALFSLKEGESFERIHELEKAAAEAGIGGDAPLSTDKDGIRTLWKADTEDNEDGAHAGFKGRVGIYEVLGNTLAIQKLIMAGATANEIQDQAIEDGMMTMQLDGVIKALRGETTIEEVLRVTREQ